MPCFPITSCRPKYREWTPSFLAPATPAKTGLNSTFAASESENLWTAILKAGELIGLLPAGLGARNTLRLEARLLLYGNDLDRSTTLLEAGLGWIVNLDKGDFIGREALARQKAEGVQRKLAGFVMLGRDIARDHYPVYVSGVEVSHVTSGSPSITLKKNIGLTYLPVAHAVVGTKLEISVRGRACGAEVVSNTFLQTEGFMNPEDLLYTKEHEWIRIAGDTGTVGITDHAQAELGDIVYIEFPQVGDRVDAGQSIRHDRIRQSRVRTLQPGVRRDHRSEQGPRRCAAKM